MGTITSGTGLISGLNTTDIINQLIAIDGRQATIVQSHIDDATAQRGAFTDLQARLTGIQITAQQISKPSFFASAAANSSDPNVLTATAATGTPLGSYQFQVARLVQAQQLVSGGFSNFDKAPVGAGSLTLELGGGSLEAQNNLNDLRGGQGVSRGQVRITDRTGKSAIIDLGDTITLDDVIKKINTSVDINVKASINNNQLVITDASGSTAGNLIVQDVGATTAAADLGIAQTSTTGTVTGTNLQYLGRDTKLASLGDGNGVNDVHSTDFQLTLKDGSTVNVDLNDAATVGQALDAINTAGAGKVVAAIKPDGSGLTLTDSSGGGGSFGINAVGGSTAAADLGFTTSAAGNVLTGGAVQAKLGSVLLKSLNGGAGLTLGTVHVVDRAAGAHDIDLSAAASVQDVLDAFNTPGNNVTASLNGSGNGIQLFDGSGGAGNLIISDASGTGAAQLGIAGTFDSSKPIVQGANLQRKWVNNSTSLAKYNGGKGVTFGKFTVTAASGFAQTITIDNQTDLTLGDVIGKINTAFAGKVVASVNAHGDGLALTDTTGGAGKLTVADVNGTTAANLNIAGIAAATVIDGSLEKTIAVTATDTLGDVQKKINDLGWGLQASVINDGSGAGAYRLSLNATNSGVAGQVTFDSGATNLNTRTLVKAQDAAVFVGSSNAAAPLLVTSSSNSVSGVIKGLTLNLTSVSKSPVTVSVTNDVTNVTKALTDFTQSYNDLIDRIGKYTQFGEDDGTKNTEKNPDGTPKDDPDAGTTRTTTTTGADGRKTTYKQGILLGDYSVAQIQDQLNALVQTVVPQAGKYRILADVGLSVTDGGHLAFDEEKFNAAYADDPTSVKTLFTNTAAAVNPSTKLRYLNEGNGVATAGDGVNDFKAVLKDGTTLNVAIGAVTRISDVLSSINAAGAGKLRAELTDNYAIKISDLTAGVATTKITQSNGSQFLANLGLTGTVTDGALTGSQLHSIDPIASASGGIGVHLQQSVNRLINPVDGLITNQSHTIDDRITQYQGRIADLNTILAGKRDRLLRQFNNLESVLAKLQSQQSSLGNIKSLAA